MNPNVERWPLRFAPWRGEPIADTYGGKAVLDCGGEPGFAEIAVLRALEKDGYEGVWVDTYRGRYRRSLSAESVTLPVHVSDLLVRIAAENSGKQQGCWDVLAWKDASYLFVECKRKGKDSIRPSQVDWLNAALRAGLGVSCFRICEWELDLMPSPAQRAAGQQ